MRAELITAAPSLPTQPTAAYARSMAATPCHYFAADTPPLLAIATPDIFRCRRAAAAPAASC
jgi:hypothetical protein